MIERRYDPIDRAWRLVSDDAGSTTSDACPLCPTRPGGPRTRIPLESFEVAVVDDRDAGPASNPTADTTRTEWPYEAAPAAGAAELVVYSDDHDAVLGALGRARIRMIVDVWAGRYAELGGRPDVDYVYIFESAAPASSHPHGHVHAYPEIPPRVLRRLEQARGHIDAHGTCVHCDVVAREQADGVRVVAQTESFVAFVPFAPRFVGEVHVLARRHAPSLLDLTDPERDSLAELLDKVLVLPCSLGIHQAPPGDGIWLPVSHFRIELVPRQPPATGAGAELGAGVFTVHAPPEETAAALRAALQA